MDASWVAAIASVASAFVVGVAAIAALLQIRHVRNANDIAIYLHLVDRLDSIRATEAFGSIEKFTAQLKTDTALRHRLAEPYSVPEFNEIETLLRFLDNLTMLILAGSVTSFWRNMQMTYCAFGIVSRKLYICAGRRWDHILRRCTSISPCRPKRSSRPAKSIESILVLPAIPACATFRDVGPIIAHDDEMALRLIAALVSPGDNVRVRAAASRTSLRSRS